MTHKPLHYKDTRALTDNSKGRHKSGYFYFAHADLEASFFLMSGGQTVNGGITFSIWAKTPMQDQRQYVRKPQLVLGEITEAKVMIVVLLGHRGVNNYG